MQLKTVYVNRKDVVKTNRSSNLNQSIATCVLHMQINQYGATYAEIIDADTEQLYANIRRHMNGDLTILYKWNPKDTETKYAVSPLLK